VSLTEVPDVDHSFATFCARGALVERVARSLFGSTEAERAASQVLEAPATMIVESGV
jgi:hypothetical protein